MRLRPALAAEILRAAQKDSAHLTDLESEVSALVLEVVGPVWWARIKEWLGPGVRTLYYVLTTVSSYQTLGEEYTGILQVTPGRLRLPSILTRLVTVLLHCLLPTLLLKLCRCVEKSLLQNSFLLTPGARSTLLHLLPVLSNTIHFLDRLNLCVFYFQGTFYHIANRLTGVSYVKIAREEKDHDDTRPIFRILGLVASIHLVIGLIQSLLTVNKRIQEEEKEDDNEDDLTSTPRPEVPLRSRCSLCLDRLGTRGVTTATSCGHVYCWRCILECLHSTGQCPQCRRRVQPHTVIPCRNY